MAIHCTVHAHTFLSSPPVSTKSPTIPSAPSIPPAADTTLSSRVRIGNTSMISHRSLRSKTIVGKKGTETSDYEFSDSTPESDPMESPFISSVTLNANNPSSAPVSSTPQWNSSSDSRNPYIFSHFAYIIGGLKVSEICFLFFHLTPFDCTFLSSLWMTSNLEYYTKTRKRIH
jgi:hypothetical protein